jgi:hypothetical protein
MLRPYADIGDMQEKYQWWAKAVLSRTIAGLLWTAKTSRRLINAKKSNL